MGNTNGTISYQSIYVNSGIKSNVISATTISANTFYGGSLSASFIGNGDVDDQEFKYISGITSNTQTQINQKVSVSTNFLTYTSSQSGLPLSKKLEGINVTLEDNGTEIKVSLPFSQTLFKQYIISASTVTSSTAITNFNLTTLFNLTNESVQVVINQGNAVISGISGGTDGRVLMITNTGSGLIILENESTKCVPNNSIKFKFSFGEACFLTRYKSIFLIYNSSEQCWKNINFGTSDVQYDYVNDFAKTWDASTQNTSSFQYNGLIPNIPIQTNITPSNILSNLVTNNFLDSNHVLNISLPPNSSTTTSTYISLHKPNRNDTYFTTQTTSTMLNLYKFSLTSTTFDVNYCFMFGFSDSGLSRRLNLNGGGSNVGFRTPFVTDTSPTYFQTGILTHTILNITQSSSLSTTLLVSSCVNSWCYAGLYKSPGYIIFITSSNGGEYNIERVYTNGAYFTPFSMLRSAPNNTTNTNSIFLDTYSQIDSGDF
jgi:hypothetical protein